MNKMRYVISAFWVSLLVGSSCCSIAAAAVPVSKGGIDTPQGITSLPLAVEGAAVLTLTPKTAVIDANAIVNGAGGTEGSSVIYKNVSGYQPMTTCSTLGATAVSNDGVSMMTCLHKSAQDPSLVWKGQQITLKQKLVLSGGTHCDVGGPWGWGDGQSICPTGSTRVSGNCPAGSFASGSGCYYKNSNPSSPFGTCGDSADECCFYMCQQQVCNMDGYDFSCEAE